MIPKDICEDPWDRSNWQALCNKCHNRKAAKDKKLIKRYKNEHPDKPKN
jgi:5-methylcytosine-specific restriction endonuclease McrA